MDTHDLLGPAEKHIAKQLQKGCADSLKPLRELAEKVEVLAELDWEAVMLDPKRKDTAVAFTDVLSKLPTRIGDLMLAVMISEVAFAEKEVA